MEKVIAGYYVEYGTGYTLKIEAFFTGAKAWGWIIINKGIHTKSTFYPTKKEAEKQARKHLKLILEGGE